MFPQVLSGVKVLLCLCKKACFGRATASPDNEVKKRTVCGSMMAMSDSERIEIGTGPKEGVRSIMSECMNHGEEQMLML